MALEGGNPSETSALLSTMGEDHQTAPKSLPKAVVIEPSATENDQARELLEAHLRRKVDRRLCTIAGILCSLNLLDSGIISSASVTSMPADLDLTGSRYSVSIFIFTVSSIVFQLPSTLAVRFIGPRIWFALITFSFGVITLCTAFIHTWRQMIALRILLGISMSGIYPGLTYLISTWYSRKEQQLRFAFLQSGEVIMLASGSILNYGLNHLHGRGGLAGWRWMYLIQGLITCTIGIITYWWMIPFPDQCLPPSSTFLSPKEAELAVSRIQADRSDSKPEPFSWRAILPHFLDAKLYGFCLLFFLLNLVSTTLSYFLPIILRSGMGFTSNQAILLSAPPYYYSVIPVLISSRLGDKFSLRSPVIAFNALSVIAGFSLLAFPSQVTVRYIGTFIASGGYISNWAALNAYQANNIVGHWKRATVAAAVTACNGLGGIAGSYIVRQEEAPKYLTAVWISIGSHVLMIVVVALFTICFWIANKKQKRGKMVLEGVEGWRYTY